MIKRALLVMAAALVFSAATPSYATFWNSHNSHRGNSWSSQNKHSNDHKKSNKKSKDKKHQTWDWNFNWDWLDCYEPVDNHCDLDWNWDWLDCDDKQPPVCDNPVPEPATAGLAFMSLGALTAAVRRRRK